MKTLFSFNQKQPMKRLLLFVFILLCSASVFSQKAKKLKLKKGAWVSELILNETDILPFEMIVHKHKRKYELTVVNGDEKIKLDEPIIKDDSIIVRFPFFNSELRFRVNNKKAISGYWHNYNKGPNYKIPFTSGRSKGYRFSRINTNGSDTDYGGRWKVTFEPNTNSSYPAVGIFKQTENSVTGTFLTETGDYRYLAGNTTSDSLYLSCFDGSHAFLFKAKYEQDTLYGKFCSGNHWKSEWVAHKNDSFTLTNPEELTYLKDENDLTFTLKDLDGNEFTYPSDEFKNKVTIIQIMGSWCPNCLDETHYYKQLFEKYHDSGLEVIAIGYETGNSFEDYSSNLKRLKEKLGLEFKFIVGGKASKNLASEHFNMLNEVISFPTSIFIGRDGKVHRVHTGFNGPGTGSYYTEYVEKTNALIESLLAK